MTYMVMETHRSYCIVLDEDGRFFKAANMGYEIGQTIDTVIEMKGYKEKKALPYKAITVVASLAACFVMIFSILLNQLPPIHGSVYLAINPEVRADVSENGIVVSLTPLNDDAVILLDEYKGKKKPLTTVANELVDRAIDLGFLSEGGTVVIDIDAPDDVWFQETGITLRQNLNSHIEQRLSVTIEIKQYAKDDEDFSPDSDRENDKPNDPVSKESSAPPPREPQQPKPSEPASIPQYISVDQALSAAFSHARVQASEAREIEIELEDDDGIMHYEISFEVENIEYDYEIHAMTAAVIKAEKDIDDD